ncbi:MAG TPA: hypothetical protein VFA09_11050 [Ktedonobacteraceae bacterium]|nr:hypothetical protein [Ktedonobacteraceae bacterium]
MGDDIFYRDTLQAQVANGTFAEVARAAGKRHRQRAMSHYVTICPILDSGRAKDSYAGRARRGCQVSRASISFPSISIDTFNSIHKVFS